MEQKFEVGGCYRGGWRFKGGQVRKGHRCCAKVFGLYLVGQEGSLQRWNGNGKVIFVFQMADSSECEEARWGVGKQDWFPIWLGNHSTIQAKADKDFKWISDITDGQEESWLRKKDTNISGFSVKTIWAMNKGENKE